MILLIPISPEVPKLLRPHLWQGLVVILAMGIIYLQADSIIQKDLVFVDNLQTLMDESPSTDVNQYLKARPLLKISPAKGDWDLRRLILANFIHGTPTHLILNMVGVFAGIRICSTFLPFLASIAIFLLGGTIGLCTSIFLTEQFSPYIPHVGASAGIFALMGAYYVYNFRFRTTYFFWYPTKRRFISLKTSWFFFMDVILMELVLSTGQRYAERLDSVDHIAHVVGFAVGLVLAIVLRFFQRWPQFLQTRGEYYYWTTQLKPHLLTTDAGKESSNTVRVYLAWLELIEINRYNDELKLRISRVIARNADKLTDAQIIAGFRTFNPTFIRLYPQYVAEAVRSLYVNGKKVSEKWLSNLPYDSLIAIAKQLTLPVEDQPYIFMLVKDYRRMQATRSAVADKKIEELISSLERALTQEVEPALPAGVANEMQSQQGAAVTNDEQRRKSRP